MEQWTIFVVCLHATSVCSCDGLETLTHASRWVAWHMTCSFDSDFVLGFAVAGFDSKPCFFSDYAEASLILDYRYFILVCFRDPSKQKVSRRPDQLSKLLCDVLKILYPISSEYPLQRRKRKSSLHRTVTLIIFAKLSYQFCSWARFLVLGWGVYSSRLRKLHSKIDPIRSCQHRRSFDEFLQTNDQSVFRRLKICLFNYFSKSRLFPLLLLLTGREISQRQRSNCVCLSCLAHFCGVRDFLNCVYRNSLAHYWNELHGARDFLICGFQNSLAY